MRTGDWVTSEGVVPMPFKFDKASNFSQLRNDPRVTLYYDYQLSVMRQLGHSNSVCFGPELAFLPGSTEAAFRTSQAQWVKAIETLTSRNKPLERYKQVSRRTNSTGRLAAESVIYRKFTPAVGRDSQHEWLSIYTFMFDNKLKSGVVLYCKSERLVKK